MVEAADAYVRILIRVPEAYLLLSPLYAKRPGLVVLDADARRVIAIDLPQDAKAIAKQLNAAVDAEIYVGVEWFRMTIKGEDGSFRKAVNDLDAVEETTQVRGEFRVAVLKGDLHPAKLERLAKQHKVEVQWRNPVKVARNNPTNTLNALPGAWYADATHGYVTDLLLSPKVFKGTTNDLDARVFKLPGVSKGGGGAKVARAPLGVKGVLTVFPDIFGGSELVVGRKGEVNWAEVTKAFKRTGVNAKMKR